MLCRRCRKSDHQGGEPVRPAADGVGCCAQCGADLASSVFDFLDKLSQLGRFGISAEDRPLLERSDD